MALTNLNILSLFETAEILFKGIYFDIVWFEDKNSVQLKIKTSQFKTRFMYGLDKNHGLKQRLGTPVDLGTIKTF